MALIPLDEHKVAEDGLTVTVGVGLTVTTTVAILEQLPLLPVTVYEVVTVGDAVTLAAVVELNPVAGLQLYVVAPLAVRVVLPPEQMEVEGLTVTVGEVVTVTVTGTLDEQPLVVPVTV